MKKEYEIDEGQVYKVWVKAAAETKGKDALLKQNFSSFYFFHI